MRTFALLVLLTGISYANNADSFGTGFANGFREALIARQQQQAQQQTQQQQQELYQQQQANAQLEEQIRLLREQVELQRQQVQQQQNEDTRKFTDTLGK